MGSPAHDAPPPPGREFVLYLLGLAVVGLAVGKFVISPIAGDAAMFVYGTIAFVAPLIGWAVTVSFGKFLWRQGDFLPVGMLFISFLCGASIFNTVIIEGYDAGYAKEWRFNWFELSGDDAMGALEAKQLDDHEYASLGLEKMVERAQESDLQASNDAETVVANAKIFWDRSDRPNLSAFDAKAETAEADYLALPDSLKLQVDLWVLKAKLAERISFEAFAAKISRLQLELKSVDHRKRKDAISKRLVKLEKQYAELEETIAMTEWDFNALRAGLVALDDETAALRARNGNKVSGGEDSYAELQIAFEESLVRANEGITVIEGTDLADVTGTSVGTHFADAEQAIYDWRYMALDPYYSKELGVDFTQADDYMAYPIDLRTAKDPHFQAFAVGIYIDNVTAITLAMVTLLAFLIHLFSIGYMWGEIRYTRFMATINLFTAGMIGLVLANNFLWLFVCWEIMGLCSYLLIGHYFEKKSAQEASMKAFFTTRIADTFMFLGMMMIFAYTGTFLFAGSEGASAAMQATGTFMGDVAYAGEGSFFALLGSQEMLIGGLGAFAMGFLCFLGPAGKSAQFPFHVWLPDAMEGPTPVSAMIHAACMVSAGVYLTARLFPLFTPEVLEIIALIGGFTALMAGTVGLVQTDLKKVLAYSTISQLGYMFLGIGVGSWYPAIFHMVAHAFFKALMFLGSGSVILGCHHEQEMPKMGGIWKKMPITAITFWVGNLSIIGMPFLFAGYYSKEAILTDSILLGESAGGWLPYVFGALGAGLTTFYMCRLMWMTFHGKPRDKHLYDHVKESPWTVTVPLIIIAVGSLFVPWPMGAAPDTAVNLSVTNVVQSKASGVEFQGTDKHGNAKKVPQAPNESWFAYTVKKPASVYSYDFHVTESPTFKVETINHLYRDKHGRAAYSNAPAWYELDRVIVRDVERFRHPHHDDAHAGDHAGSHGKTADAHASAASIESAMISDGGHAPSGAKKDKKPKVLQQATSPASLVFGHDIHDYHETHHHAHVMAFMVALVMLGLGIGLSIFLYLGPMTGKDWVGHKGFGYRVKKTLQAAYYMDNFYFGTVLRANRWLRQVCAWFDRTFVDGFVNLMGVFGRWKSRVAAKMDFWGVDGSVRGVSNATDWTGRQAQRATTGRIQDYVFLLVAGIVVLYIMIVLFR